VLDNVGSLTRPSSMSERCSNPSMGWNYQGRLLKKPTSRTNVVVVLTCVLSEALFLRFRVRMLKSL
jgi:hypothetical protein